jgi:hypothetical protein
MPDHDVDRAQIAVRTLAQTRAELRALLIPGTTQGTLGRSDQFPRSKTFRWLLGQSVGRRLGSALLSGVMSRLPMGWLIGSFIPTRKA